MIEPSASVDGPQAEIRPDPTARSGDIPRSQRRVFAAFAGGGAKGLVHVGALAALEARYVRIVGFAGTSAGAIVAALAAAGFTADEIIHPREHQSILDRLQQFDPTLRRPVDLFGPGGWAQILPYRWLGQFLTLPRLAALAAVAGLSAVFTAFFIARHGVGAAILAVLLWSVVLAVVSILALSALAGLAQLHTFRSALSRLLSEKVFPDEPDRPVLMKDFNGRDRALLKIVAADLTHQRLELFSCDTTEDVPVADAVAASICLPVIFRAWPLDLSRYVDGGIVSNLPAWPFDEERQLDPEAITVAFEIGTPLTPEAPPKPPSALGWVPALLGTALFGSRSLSMRAVGLSELITLRPTLSMMDFDLSPEDTREELRNATAFAAAEIDRRLFAYPETYERACAQAVELTEIFLDTADVLAAPPRSGRVRVGAALPIEKFRHSLRLRFGANFHDDPDQNVALPIEGSMVGETWTKKRQLFHMAPFPKRLDMSGDDRRALRRFFWRDLAWSLCVPILGPDGEPRCVVTVDGSDRLRDTRETRAAFRGLAAEIRKIFTPIVWHLQE
ncbi:patatin-like phospholipase family protein [Phenylobacterium sp.]|uniref:patatin-like phospholipase family protein n=1 Tax=Phenylobacterium sp. TaxID=1871053 RepID=UPI0035B067A4